MPSFRDDILEILLLMAAAFLVVMGMIGLVLVLGGRNDRHDRYHEGYLQGRLDA